MDLLILRHIGLVRKIIEIPRVGLRVQLRHERRALLSQLAPLDLDKICVPVDLADAAEALRRGRHQPRDQVPGALAEEVVGILELGLLEHLLPVPQVLPRLVDRRAGEGRVAGQRFEEHAAQAPVVDREVVFFALEHFGGHVVWRTDDGFGVVDVALAEGPVAFAAFGDGSLVHGAAEWNGHFAYFFELDAHRLDFDGREHAGCEAKVGQFDVPGGVDQEILGFQIAMDVAELM